MSRYRPDTWCPPGAASAPQRRVKWRKGGGRPAGRGCVKWRNLGRSRRGRTARQVAQTRYGAAAAVSERTRMRQVAQSAGRVGTAVGNRGCSSSTADTGSSIRPCRCRDRRPHPSGSRPAYYHRQVAVKRGRGGTAIPSQGTHDTCVKGHPTGRTTAPRPACRGSVLDVSETPSSPRSNHVLPLAIIGLVVGGICVLVSQAFDWLPEAASLDRIVSTR